jgi:septum site-determining protein MinC
VFALSEVTKESLETHKIKPATGLPASLQADGTISGGTPQQGTISGASDKTEKSESGVVDCNPACDFTPADNSVDVRIEGGDEHHGAESASESGSCTTGADSAEASTAEKTTASKGTDTSETDSPKVTAAPPVPHVLYLRQTLRSGQMISHKGHLVIVGDVNPGAEVMADGDITIWGALRGVAHAGIGGNTDSEIRALKFDPIQLRIANAIARSPDRPKVNLKTNGPETARIVNGIIRISSSAPE